MRALARKGALARMGALARWVRWGRGGAGAVGAVVAVSALAAAGCSGPCATNPCVAPVFDLAMSPVSDLALTRDLAITSAAVVAVGAGAANTFSPSTVTIHAGQSVTWNWVSGLHSVVSDTHPEGVRRLRAAGERAVHRDVRDRR